jgi:hypothetical protein
MASNMTWPRKRTSSPNASPAPIRRAPRSRSPNAPASSSPPLSTVSGTQLHTAPGLIAFSRAVSAWRAEVIRKSGLFESVSIEESTTIPTPAAGEVVFAAKGPALNAIALAPDKLQVIPEGPQGLVVTSITGPNYEMTFMRAPNDAAQWTQQVRDALAKL